MGKLDIGEYDQGLNSVLSAPIIYNATTQNTEYMLAYVGLHHTLLTRLSGLNTAQYGLTV